jgi:8-oxo-dGTP pyrophosphatase MutT (NUDIX family)
MYSTDYKGFIKNLEEGLKNPLPGQDFQFSMAPEVRREMDYVTPGRPAAVMILLFPDADRIKIVFIKRTEYNGPHSGQISFPGGMFEIFDKDLEATAIRETTEETGISGIKINILGKLSLLHIPVSNFTVHPFVGVLQEIPVFKPDPAEVKYLITEDLSDFFNPFCRIREEWTLFGEAVNVPIFSINSHQIWGATAMILSEFLEVIDRSGLHPGSY